MMIDRFFQQIPPESAGHRLLPMVLDCALTQSDEREFLQSAVEEIATRLPARQTLLVQGTKGAWRTLVKHPPSDGDGPSIEWLAESLDSGEPVIHPPWGLAPLSSNQNDGCLLVVEMSATKLDATDLDSLAAAIAAAREIFMLRHEPLRKAARLAALLEMTTEWNQTHSTDELLEQMAHAATRLLGAERATIFLFDSQQKNLIGKPALGVENETLIVPAGSGVVGEVVKTGQPRRIDADIADEQQQIHREVDQRLGFETRSLLCVPLIDSQGQVMGAFELINKVRGNFSESDQAALTELAAHAAVAIETTRHVQQLETTRRVAADEAAGQVQLIGHSPAMQELRETIERVAGTDLAILVTGENGTGKEVVAQMIHYLSPRRDEVLVAVNCAAITESLLESELFGHEKGAFTDAHQSRPGKFELADLGTLFLDEIGDMSPGGQAKLLRVLEEKVVVRVGGSTPIPTNARIIAATNQNLAELVREKRFREDLFFRLNVVTLELPPLRERGDDILELAEFFLKQFSAKARRQPPRFTAAARKRLLSHAWPGNVRELRNMMERLAYLSTSDVIDAADLPFIQSPTATREKENQIRLDLDLTEATRQFQIDYIQQHLDAAGGNVTAAARRMGMHRSNLYRKMRQLKMNSEEVD